MHARQDKIFLRLFALLLVFVTAHNVDHLVRDGWSIPLMIVVVVIYALVGGAIVQYRRGHIGPRFLAIAATAGLAFGWFSHFSPYTSQPVGYIYHAYASSLAGGIAVAVLLGIMLTVAAIALYALYLWFTGRAQTSRV